MAKIDSSTSKRKADQAVIRAALKILRGRLRKPGATFLCPNDVSSYLSLNLCDKSREEFWVLFLDAGSRLIQAECLFVGTLTRTVVFPREVAKRALMLSAATAIIAHNHPSGTAKPSREDERLTCGICDALRCVDVKLLDHIVVGGAKTYSFMQEDHAPFGSRSLFVKLENENEQSTPHVHWKRPARWGRPRLQTSTNRGLPAHYESPS